MTKDNQDIRTLEAAVQSARDVLEAAVQTERQARGAATDARNRYNDACKAFDTAVEELKKGSPRDTDWYNGRNR